MTWIAQEPRLLVDEESAAIIHELVKSPIPLVSIQTTLYLQPGAIRFITQAQPLFLQIQSKSLGPAIQPRDPDRYPSRSADVSFSNLHVHGFGFPTDYLGSALKLWGWRVN